MCTVSVSAQIPRTSPRRARSKAEGSEAESLSVSTSTPSESVDTASSPAGSAFVSSPGLSASGDCTAGMLTGRGGGGPRGKELGEAEATCTSTPSLSHAQLTRAAGAPGRGSLRDVGSLLRRGCLGLTCYHAGWRRSSQPWSLVWNHIIVRNQSCLKMPLHDKLQAVSVAAHPAEDLPTKFFPCWHPSHR